MTDHPREASEPIRILLVEDALDQALLVRAMLSSDVYEVTHAQDGVTGLDHFRSRDFDLVITDLNLPGMDGFDLTRAMKEHRPDVPVVAATGYTSPGYADAAYRAGVDVLLRKPLDQRELLKTLRELLPEIHPAPEVSPNVFALGARPGDVALACGGTLAFHRAQGHDVLIFILEAGDPGSGLDARAARWAAERLGARVILADPAGTEEDLAERQILLEEIVRELNPAVAYIPSAADHDPARKEAHRLGRLALTDARAVLAYGTPTASFEFRPSFFKPIEAYMTQKLEALQAFSDGARQPAEFSPSFVEGCARYWGRLASFGEVEPFEVIKGEGRR